MTLFSGREPSRRLLKDQPICGENSWLSGLPARPYFQLHRVCFPCMQLVIREDNMKPHQLDNKPSISLILVFSSSYLS